MGARRIDSFDDNPVAWWPPADAPTGVPPGILPEIDRNTILPVGTEPSPKLGTNQGIGVDGTTPSRVGRSVGEKVGVEGSRSEGDTVGKPTSSTGGCVADGPSTGKFRQR